MVSAEDWRFTYRYSPIGGGKDEQRPTEGTYWFRNWRRGIRADLQAELSDDCFGIIHIGRAHLNFQAEGATV